MPGDGDFGDDPDSWRGVIKSPESRVADLLWRRDQGQPCLLACLLQAWLDRKLKHLGGVRHSRLETSDLRDA